MDIDLKNSLSKLLAACDAIDDGKSDRSEKIRNAVVQDIFSFIRFISKASGVERIQLFNTLYLNGEYEDRNKESDKVVSVPASFKTLCRFDQTMLKNSDVKVTALYLAFVVELGKHYLHSKYDKTDIDQQNYLDYVKSLQAYLKENDSVRKSDISLLYKNSLAPDKKMKSDRENVHVETVEQAEISEPKESLEELMEQLNSLIGLLGVKKEVNSLVNMIKINKIRESRGFTTANVSRHLVFLGNPGTGKTTVARLLSKIYKQLGALEKGQLVEVDRAGLVAGYVGQTALKTKEKIDEAMGGILFIDEAYTLAKGGNDFGQEAIDTLLKAMEDKRDAFIVIVAGYPEPMEAFLNSNPGLKSRFNKSIYFEDYSPEELISILELFCNKIGVTLNTNARELVTHYIERLCHNKPENFANGREMRNLFEAAISNQANRLASYSDVSDAELNEITESDLPEYVTA